MLRHFIKATLWMSFGLLVGRFTGFLRESLIAYRFGITENADIVVLMLTAPDLLISLLAGGALSAVLIPEFKKLDLQQSWALFIKASIFSVCAFVFLILIISIYITDFIHFIAPGMPISIIEKSQKVFYIVLWVTPLTILAGISTAYLQAREDFFITAFSTIIFNSAIILGLIICTKNSILLLIGWFVVLGGLLRWISQIFYLIKYCRGLRFTVFPLVNRTILVRYLQALSSGSFVLFLPYIARAFASYTSAGGVATFNYATKLVELPLGVCITLFSVVLFPKLAECFNENKNIALGTVILSHGIKVVTILSIALMISLTFFGQDIANLIFRHGAVSEDTSSKIGLLAMIGFLSLPFQGISSLLVAAYNARKDTATPFYISLSALIIYIPIAYIMRKLFGLYGLMSGISSIYLYIAILQIFLLNKKYKISICGIFLTKSFLFSIITMLCVFLPFTLITHFLNTDKYINVACAILSIPFLILSSILVIPEYRIIAIKWLSKQIIKYKIKIINQ